jgi:hypothetical protein
MDTSQTWVEALKISPEKLSEWSEQAPAETPLLVWCLQEGHISPEDYFEWACEHFGLPILNSAFFTQSFDRTSLEPHRSNSLWSPWYFPVGQWDDVTLIACAEPPAERPEGACAFVLADPAAMREVWGLGEAKKDAELEAPMGINPNATKTFILNLDSTMLMQDHVEPVKPTAKEPKPNHVDPPNLAAPTPIKAKTASAPPPTPPAKKSPLAVAAAVAQATPAQNPEPAAAKVKPIKGAPNPNEDSEIAAAFEHLRKDYQSSLIMRVSENAVKPYKWDPKLPVVAGQDKWNVNLSYPSFFRIVSKTMQPYHGYVIDSPAHQQFFASLNFPKAPACVTAIPLKHNGNLWGVLVAFGSETSQTGDALNHALEIGEKLGKTLDGTFHRLAA